jgi:hypothetical protein
MKLTSPITTGDFSCAVRRDISDRIIRNPATVYSLATGVSQHDDMQATQWITDNLLGNNEFAQDLAYNFTALARQRYSINDRYTKAYYLNPGFNWPGTSSIALSDKMVAIVAITLVSGLMFVLICRDLSCYMIFNWIDLSCSTKPGRRHRQRGSQAQIHFRVQTTH